MEKHFRSGSDTKADETIYQPEEDLTTEDTMRSQREYFGLMEGFFQEATETTAKKFLEKGESCHEAIQRRRNDRFVKCFGDALDNYLPKIEAFHSKTSDTLLRTHQSVAGLKCVIGGSSKFPETAFDGFRKFALCADTIFVPDPILPWIEVDRRAERFRHLYFLQSCLYLLKLKPLIDTDLPYPAVIVFPSWEKSLESANKETRDLISEFLLSFFSYYLNSNFEDESELVEYISNKGKELFRKTVISKQLFLPPNSLPPKNFNEAVEKYTDFMHEERSDEYIERTDAFAPEILVLNGMFERLLPQFHVRDNSEMLRAHALFWLPVHCHYFRLCSRVGNSELNQLGSLEQKTMSILQALQHPTNNWLGNTPIDEIATLRANNCNEVFRKKLAEYFSALSNADFNEINSVATEIGRAIASLISEHDKEVEKINEKYIRKNIITLGMAGLTVGVLFFPSFAPYLGNLSECG